MCVNAADIRMFAETKKNNNTSESGGLQLAKCKKGNATSEYYMFLFLFRALQKYITQFKDCVSIFFSLDKMVKKMSNDTEKT